MPLSLLTWIGSQMFCKWVIVLICQVIFLGKQLRSLFCDFVDQIYHQNSCYIQLSIPQSERSVPSLLTQVLEKTVF